MSETLKTRLPLTAEQILTMCQRAFGPVTQPAAVRELAAGTFNSTYRVEFEAQPPRDSRDVTYSGLMKM